MPKRKRGSEPSLVVKLEKLQDEVFRALKAAKGFERQRIARRSRDAGIGEDKKQRLDRELSVLKSLDLHQTAKAHLYASLLKVKSIAASTDLPDEIRAAVPKPNLSPEEQAALHNVTSGLYNREPVKQAIDRATAAICDSLKVPLPEKAKRSRKSKEEPKEEPKSEHKDKKAKRELELPEDSDEESDFQGFESDVDEPGPAVGELGSEDEAKEEAEFSKYDDLLGSSSDETEEEEEEEDPEEAFFRKLRSEKRAKETVNLEDISSGSESEAESLAEDESEPEEEAAELSKGGSRLKKETLAANEAKPARSTRETTFLPSLMGGYISGSESASDVDVAPPKKRLGQRQRQAIAEKKYGDKARHVVNGTSRIQGRDGGWDAKRGAVDSTDRRGGKPWKKGREPFRKQGGQEVQEPQQAPKPPKPTKRDDTGPLHPSWEARKKAKEAQKSVAFAGSKVTFN